MSVKTSSVMNGVSESGTWVTFLCFYWNVTYIPYLKHNYFHSVRPILNVLGGFLTQSFILVMMQRSRLYDSFRCKALIITLKWTISYPYWNTKCNVRMLLDRKRGWKVQIIIIIKRELLFCEHVLQRKNISRTVHKDFFSTLIILAIQIRYSQSTSVLPELFWYR